MQSLHRPEPSNLLWKIAADCCSRFSFWADGVGCADRVICPASSLQDTVNDMSLNTQWAQTQSQKPRRWENNNQQIGPKPGTEEEGAAPFTIKPAHPPI